MDDNNNGMMFLMLMIMVFVVGMFVWFIAKNSQPNTIEVKPPQISMPKPAKPGAQ